jgi:hypothetical protein
MRLRHAFLLCALFLFCPRWAEAQPGPDPTRFDALETCNESYLGREYVFVGRVVSLKDVRNPFGTGTPLWKALVSVDTMLKGQLSGEAQLVIAWRPPTLDWMVKGKRFIFTADRVSNGEINGLYTTKWSTPLDDLPPGVVAEVLDDVRAVLRGEPQPRLAGTLREQDQGVSFLPTAGRAMPGVVVVAESKDRRQFKTRTNEEGQFQFKELPPGDYAVSPELRRKMELYDHGFTQTEGGKKYVRVDDRVCSRELRFVAQEAGSVVGRIELEGGKRTDGEPLMYLHRVDPKSHAFDYEGGRLAPTKESTTRTGAGPSAVVRFSFERVPVGEYVLSFVHVDAAGSAETVFYPGTRYAKGARVINVTADKPTEVVMKLP